ncbi:prevent-host-death family protein [Bellilinea caldifistulae]|uniref:Antitoxin n=1 Tax=Bellilinea caldifistulae TaxID=360411 RepID=A0A0P6XMF8_9CHLR|nr:type II toxin-antitoxin system Phd/YefM family antitoxin [Bellilinea caldifistulae]KPL77565.1 prevent-host-death protein [Bellilinea caldifistulae]GAP09648.1 prevent-host-death family protein [Bellilinea caldifistulae]
MNLWQLQEAKSRFSELVERTLRNGAQIVTRRGKKVVVVLSYEEYRRLTNPQRNLAQFLLQSPLAGSELKIERDQSLPREVDLQP